jgi:hypothetical protein
MGGDLGCLEGFSGGHLGLTCLLTPHWRHMGVLGACHFSFPLNLPMLAVRSYVP